MLKNAEGFLHKACASSEKGYRCHSRSRQVSANIRPLDISATNTGAVTDTAIRSDALNQMAIETQPTKVFLRSELTDSSPHQKSVEAVEIYSSPDLLLRFVRIASQSHRNRSEDMARSLLLESNRILRYIDHSSLKQSAVQTVLQIAPSQSIIFLVAGELDFDIPSYPLLQKQGIVSSVEVVHSFSFDIAFD
jgi:hypothetical protein